MPLIATLPDPSTSTLDDVRFNPAMVVVDPPRPSIVIFPLVVFKFTAAPLICTPSNVPVR